MGRGIEVPEKGVGVSGTPKGIPGDPRGEPRVVVRGGIGGGARVSIVLHKHGVRAWQGRGAREGKGVVLGAV